MAKSSVEPEVKLTLGEYLASIRTDRGLSQRDVEKATNKVVSNAYLSQIENDQIGALSEKLESHLAARRLQYLVALCAQAHAQELSNGRLIIDHQNL